MIPLQWFWLVAVALVAACVGSFLNVVIYRFARGLSVRRPARSFCPGCEQTIAWYDNVPVLSYLMLAGRCRRCGMPISIRYPLVEGLTVLLFVLAYDTFFLGPARAEFTALGTDWPVFLAHLVLLGALVVTSAIDIEGYWIDVTITYGVVSIGVIAHGLWTPGTSAAFPRPWAPTAAGALAATVGLIVAALLWRRAEPDENAHQEVSEAPRGGATAGRQARSSPVSLAWLMVIVIVCWLVLLVIDADRLADAHAFAMRAGLVLVACFAVLVGAGMAPTEAEADIVEAIHEERSQARGQSARELAWLLPAILLGTGGALVVSYWPTVGSLWERALAWAPLGGDPGGAGSTWRPVLGVTTGLAGFIVAGAIGWAVRIVFTLALGKEAFGLGDVHLMAAAGAVAGWPVVAIGFFLACPLAVVAVLIWLARKRSRAVWFGPWLGLGVVGGMAAYAPIADRVGTMLEVWAWAFGGPSR